MKATYKKLLVCQTLLCLSACGWVNKEKKEGDPAQSAENVVKEWKLQDTWESECAQSDFLPTYYQQKKYKFEGDQFTLKTEYYFGNEACTGKPNITQTDEGIFKLGKINEDTDHARNVDFFYKHSFMEPHTDESAQDLNQQSLCGHTQWKKDVQFKLDDKKIISLTCPLYKVSPGNPKKHFDIAKIENDKLYFGYANFWGLSTSRPTELDREKVYTKR